MALPHQDDDEEERKDSEESHHPINPAYSHLRNPLIDVEVDRETEEQAHRVDGYCSFDRM